MTQIFYEGHSNCRIKDSINIWIDPFFTGNSLSKNDWRTLEKPDVVLVTHGHGDHLGDAIEIVKETKAKLGCIVELAEYCKTLGVPAELILNYGMGWNFGGTIEYEQTKFTMYPAFHSCPHGVPASFVITCKSGFTCYHAGDTGLFGDMKLIGEAHNIDIALLPIGDVFTMDAVQAAKATKFLNAKSAMPMHYSTFPIIEQGTEKFEKALKEINPSCTFFKLEPNQFSEIV